MKKILNILFIILLCLSSCRDKVKSVKENRDSIKNDSVVKYTSTRSAKNGINKYNRIDDTTIQTRVPQITPLPFGIKPDEQNFYESQAYFLKLVYTYQGYSNEKNFRWHRKVIAGRNIYKLPTIKSIEYQSIRSTVDTDVCKNGRAFGDYLKLTKYRYRLPDIGKYQCFYWCDQASNDNSDYNFEVQTNCEFCFQHDFYGYFILYDPQTLSAKVMTIYFDTEQDTTQLWRFFLIDTNYNITIFENGQSGEGPDKPETPYRIKLVSILKDGSINIH
jgi:hypothetical protein